MKRDVELFFKFWLKPMEDVFIEKRAKARSC